MSKGFKLEGDLVANVATMPEDHKKAVLAAAHYIQPQAIEYMRQTAPWTDQTGNARNGLQAEVKVEPNKVAIVLFHSVDYGVFLETRWGGKFAVIRPTVDVMAKRFVETIGKLIFK